LNLEKAEKGGTTVVPSTLDRSHRSSRGPLKTRRDIIVTAAPRDQCRGPDETKRTPETSQSPAFRVAARGPRPLVSGCWLCGLRPTYGTRAERRTFAVETPAVIPACLLAGIQIIKAVELTGSPTEAFGDDARKQKRLGLWPSFPHASWRESSVVARMKRSTIREPAEPRISLCCMRATPVVWLMRYTRRVRPAHQSELVRAILPAPPSQHHNPQSFMRRSPRRQLARRCRSLDEALRLRSGQAPRNPGTVKAPRSALLPVGDARPQC
jgi:hypothetical protein